MQKNKPKLEVVRSRKKPYTMHYNSLRCIKWFNIFNTKQTQYILYKNDCVPDCKIKKKPHLKLLFCYKSNGRTELVCILRKQKKKKQKICVQKYTEICFWKISSDKS